MQNKNLRFQTMGPWVRWFVRPITFPQTCGGFLIENFKWQYRDPSKLYFSLTKPNSTIYQFFVLTS